ncbi:MAG: PBP1A family penicillin-binding protein [Elusimicrobiota bacterium]|nr:PBP1A family penicillin-binding protein [Elusimicrobiota bacterium]
MAAMPRSRFYALAAPLLLGLILGLVGLRLLLVGLPQIHALEDYAPSQTTRIFDASGVVAAELSIEKRALLPLSKIPVDLQNAVIAVEDDAFFKHWGLSPRGILRAAVRNLIARRVVQGASTITQQLAKQIFLKPERKLSRKMREVLLAIQIERNFSKPEILQFYLNQVYFGEGAYGAQAAARNYFGKEIGELTLSECALLAGLIRAPRANSPFYKPDNARRRRSVVLSRMEDEGMITKAEREAAEAQPVPLVKPIGVGSQAPYFVEHVRRRLEFKYGTAAVWRGGLKVGTTLDLTVQKHAEEVMYKALDEFDVKAATEHAKKMREYELSGESLPPDVSTSPPSKIQGAFVLMDVKTGAIRAMIGGRESIFNRVTQAKRQPGSTFKPFVWAAALGAGMTAASLIDDTPLAFYFDGRDWRLLEGATDQYSINLATQPFAASPDFKIWVPNNFDGKFMGRVTLRRAIAQSRNISAINLITQIGPPLVAEIAHRAGIRSDLEPAPALALGSSVVTPLEMANAFATFANGGIAVTPYTIETVEDAAGKQLEAHVPSDREAMTPQLAYLVTNVLKAVVQGGTGVRARALGRPLAGKTGTSNDNRDLWFVGYTPDFVAVAWMGYDDFTSLGRKDWTGGSTVVPWWTAIMEGALKDQPKRDFAVPPGIVFAAIDAETGLLHQPTCPRKNRLLEAFQQGTAPTAYCEVDHLRPVAEQVDAAPAPDAAPGSMLPPGSTAPPVGLPAEDPDAPAPLPTDDELGPAPAEEETGLE